MKDLIVGFDLGNGVIKTTDEVGVWKTDSGLLGSKHFELLLKAFRSSGANVINIEE